MNWKDGCLLGLAALDLEHKRIFNCFVAAEKGLAKDDTWLVNSSTAQLGSLIQAHFAVEERLMWIFGYPDIERHIEEHRQFLADVREWTRESLSSNRSVSLETIKIARERLRKHIMASDRHYADYFSDLARLRAAQNMSVAWNTAHVSNSTVR